ncbi:MAG: hypothetical protein SF053_07200 [Bacteroidia bacterium]|nr:hypothetical protein [Bacteroidia bacterium]
MRLRLLLLWISLWITNPSLAQLHSTHGAVHTPAGDLHILVIFVRFTDAVKMHAPRTWPDETSPGVLPEMATGAANKLFYNTPAFFDSQARTANLSDYYYTMSGGRFRLTADIFPEQVPVSFVPETGANFFSRQGQMNQAAVKWITEHYPDFDWSVYDRRTNHPAFRQDNQTSPPDNVLDYVVFMYRAFGATGMGSSGNFAVPGTPYRIQDGHTGIQCYGDAEHNWEYFKHEFAHNLYDAPHYLGANGSDGEHLYIQKGWGMMAGWHTPFFTANAWECWWMGWIAPQEITRSGTYRLRDFVTGRDAISIVIPGTQDRLWLENHQKRDLWDEKLYYKDTAQGQPLSSPGLYMYVTAAPGYSREHPQLNPFDKSHANLIRMYHGEGNADYRFDGDSLKGLPGRFPIFSKTAPNPISGQNDFQTILADFNGDGKITLGLRHGNRDAGRAEGAEVWAERRDSLLWMGYHNTGNAGDALLPGDETGLSGIFPTLNYPRYLVQTESLQPYILNGITIRVLSLLPDGTLELQVDLNDWTLRHTQRWCGPISLQALAPGQPPLVIGPGTVLTLDLSGTADRSSRHPETGTFSNPTRLTARDSTQIIIQQRARVDIGMHAGLHLTDSTLLTIGSGGTLHLHTGGSLIIDAGARLVIKKGGRLLIEPATTISPESLSRIEVQRGGKIRRVRQIVTTHP